MHATGAFSFSESSNVFLNVLETAAVIYGTARNVVVIFRTVERKVNAKMFAFAKVKERIVKKRAVRVDGKVELKVAGSFAFVYGCALPRTAKAPRPQSR